MRHLWIFVFGLCGLVGPSWAKSEKGKEITMTILYDNYVFQEGLKSDWGFSCLVKGTEKTILFDTGTRGDLLLENMAKLKVDPKIVDLVVLSHYHQDHTGGLSAFLKKNPKVTVYALASFGKEFIRNVKEAGAQVIPVDKPMTICKDVCLTGSMGDRIKEQSLMIHTAKGLVVITGCSHPGIVQILKRAQTLQKKDIHLVFGGFHLMAESEKDLQKIIEQFKSLKVAKVGPTHCTGAKAIQEFKKAYGTNFLPMGVGRVLHIPPVPQKEREAGKHDS
jgi:7,8-dihydropterin-6-yl-methyl-4-(beta-D-ribofuranosyl)aminobenzene 5'-phosphate synthase